MNNDKVERAVASVQNIALDSRNRIMDNGGLDFADVLDVYNGIMLVISTVQTQQPEGELTEEEKKEVAAQTINWMIDIPVLPEGLEGKLFGLLVEMAFLFYKDTKKAEN